MPRHRGNGRRTHRRPEKAGIRVRDAPHMNGLPVRRDHEYSGYLNGGVVSSYESRRTEGQTMKYIEPVPGCVYTWSKRWHAHCDKDRR